MTFRQCTACAEVLDAADFYARTAKCKECTKKSARDYYRANKEICNKRNREYDMRNRDHLNAVRREKERAAWAAGSEKIKAKYRAKMARRRANNPKSRIADALRNRIANAIRTKGLVKSARTTELLGCETDQFISHIECQFKDGMSLDNFGKWHIDHIVPLAKARSEDELVRLFHFRNLQPLWAADNMAKGART